MRHPRRRFTIRIMVTGDTWEDVAHSLRDLLPHVEEHGPACSSVSGGSSTGHIVEVTEDPEMTHEKYTQELETYLADLRSKK